MLIATLGLALAPSGALAYDFERTLRPGMKGSDVRALQLRIAGWYPGDNKVTFSIDGAFGPQTSEAINKFETHYGLNVNGQASEGDFEVLNSLQDKDNSTKHFDWSEFVQNKNSSCSAKANAYAGGFAGGPVSAKKTKRNVKRLMWRLEAVRAKGGGNAVGINSGFRSLPYNNCIGGAGASQHLYGTAADNRMAGVTNRKERNIARRSQVHGIGCYSGQTHNHFDLRVQNRDLASSQFWWWPDQDSKGRDLDEGGKPCWGESATKSARTSSIMMLREVQNAVPGAGSLVPSVEEISAFESAGEVSDLSGSD